MLLRNYNLTTDQVASIFNKSRQAIITAVQDYCVWYRNSPQFKVLNDLVETFINEYTTQNKSII
jgi:hypothetical protein